SQLSALAPPRIVEQLKALPFVVTRSGVVVRKTDIDYLLAHIPLLLAPHASGLSHDKLLRALPGTGVAVMDEALQQLLACGLISERGDQLLLPRPDEERALAHS